MQYSDKNIRYILESPERTKMAAIEGDLGLIEALLAASSDAKRLIAPILANNGRLDILKAIVGKYIDPSFALHCAISGNCRPFIGYMLNNYEDKLLSDQLGLFMYTANLIMTSNKTMLEIIFEYPLFLHNDKVYTHISIILAMTVTGIGQDNPTIRDTFAKWANLDKGRLLMALKTEKHNTKEAIKLVEMMD
jgi:hypothetical protein